MTRYTTPARSQGNAFMQHTMARLDEEDVRRWVFVDGMDPEVEPAVRTWLVQRLNVFHRELQLTHTSRVRSTGIACTPASHMRSERKTEDERGEG